jgi:hypothetical protein
LKPIAIEEGDEDRFPDSRAGAVTRLVRRFIDARDYGSSPSPGVAEGYIAFNA